VHTEGCGFGGESMHKLLHRTYRGYVTHPNVAAALLLEHGCEKVPNDVMRRQLELAGIPLDRFGWASVQLDGGIQKTLDKVETWFAERTAQTPALNEEAAAPNVGLLTASAVSASTALALAELAHAIVAAGGSILVPESDPLLANEIFREALLGATAPHATLAYGQPITQAGLHVVASETDHWVENLTGLGGSGAHVFVTVASEHARQGHPLLPVIQFAEANQRGALPADDVDAFFEGDADADYELVRRILIDVLQRRKTPVATNLGFTDFQLTRGLLGVST
jgi:altronate dehydratase